MKLNTWIFALIVLLVILVAGCTSTNSGAGSVTNSPGDKNPSSTTIPGSAPPGTTTVSSAVATCPAITATNTWAGKWDTYANGEVCMDERQRMYPPSKDYPDPWNNPPAGAGNFHVPVTFTQDGCDVKGSMKIEPGAANVAPENCPITLTGAVDSTGALRGTWHAFCDIEFSGGDNPAVDSGVFSMNMNPDGSGIVGRFVGTNPQIQEHAAGCPTANSNWVGKRS